MLVISRRPGQSVLIGKDIEVFVLEVEGMQVRVGFNAPRTIRILRRELMTQVESENRRAAGSIHVAMEELPNLPSHLRTPDGRASEVTRPSGLVIPGPSAQEGQIQHPGGPESRG